MTASALAVAAIIATMVGGCASGRADERDSVSASTGTAGRASWDPAQWHPPEMTELRNDSVGAAVRRGLALITATHDSLPMFTGGNLNCTSCHLDEGRRPTASPFGGVYARYPRYIERTGAVVPIEDRVNYCFTRSLAGRRLPDDSRPMQDIVAYFAFVSRGVPVGAGVGPSNMPVMPRGTGDPKRGATLYGPTCARCHGSNGSGTAKVPALWGPKSFSIGASMARQERAASFIRYNMPFDRPGTLDDRDAYDIAAYITSQPRPDLPGKEKDWPSGDAPRDVPYDTRGHKAYLPPPILSRSAADAYVAAPRPLAKPAAR